MHSSRREFIAGAAAVAAAGALAGPASATAPRRRARRTVAVLGGGVAGLTAAHELAERGFDVTVYERRGWGGKARSLRVPGSARDGRRPLPAEHGWRLFFPGYQNVIDTMSRIPFGSQPGGVSGNLVTAPLAMFTRDGGRHPTTFPFGAPDPRPYTPAQVLDTMLGAFEWHDPADAQHFVQRLVVFLSSGERRRFGQWERQSWSEFLRAAQMAESDRRLYTDFATRFAAASRGEIASARSIGKAFESAFYLELTGRGASRILDLPTNEAWIDPWTAHLRRLGVKLRLGHEVTRLSLRRGRIVGARVRGPRGTADVRADWYVCALPVERARRLWSAALAGADPRLARTRALRTGWMNGIMFYLREPTPIVRGGVIHLDSPWALSAVSQAQFWPDRDFTRDYGDGQVRDDLSVDVSDWTTPGIVYGKPARECTVDQVAREVWEQMRRHFAYAGAPDLSDGLLHSWFLDPGIRRRGRRVAGSDDPLFLNTVGSWDDRPEAATAIPNLLLASDYVRVDFDITTMEGANEAARRAVNALLERSGSSAPPCAVFDRYLPPEWEPFRRLDDELYAQGRPNQFDGTMSLAQLRRLLEGGVG